MNVVVVSILFLLIPICMNLYALKYLYDIKQNKTCEKINSPYLQIFFDWYILELIVLCFCILIIKYFLEKVKQKKKIDLKTVKFYADFITGNRKVFELFAILVSGLMIKLLNDISNEPECKDIDNDMRISLFWLNIGGFVMSIFNILTK